jgi:hypothetical protein
MSKQDKMKEVIGYLWAFTTIYSLIQLGEKLHLAIQRFMHIGLDDTDSTKGGCTTYLAALLVEKLGELAFTLA